MDGVVVLTGQLVLVFVAPDGRPVQTTSVAVPPALHVKAGIAMVPPLATLA